MFEEHFTFYSVFFQRVRQFIMHGDRLLRNWVEMLLCLNASVSVQQLNNGVEIKRFVYVQFSQIPVFNRVVFLRKHRPTLYHLTLLLHPAKRPFRRIFWGFTEEEKVALNIFHELLFRFQ